MVGDTLRPLNAIITVGDSDDPLPLSTYTVKFQMEAESDGTAVQAETVTGVTQEPTQSFTADATTDLITCNAHGVKQGNQVVLANSGGALPAGLAASTRYFAIQIGPNTFALAATPNGPAIDITGAGTGTNTFYVVGSVQYTLTSGNVTTAGRYSAWFTVYSGTDRATAPVKRQGVTVEIYPFGN